MTDRQKGSGAPEDIFSAWMKLGSDFLGAMARAWPSPGPGRDAEKKAEAPDSLFKMWNHQLHTWGALQKGLGGSGALEASAKILAALPDLSVRLMQTSTNGFSLFQKRWTDQLRKAGESTGTYNFSDLDRDFLNRWTEVYVQEFQKFLNVPQLGLTRFYQEKFNAALDRYNLFQAANQEFLQLLGIPVIKSVQVLHDQVAEMAGQGTLPEDSRRIYQMWIKVLEGHYMTLFQSPEYTAAMGKAIRAMNAFLAARQEVLEALLKTVPVPTQKELDELYREIYLLKKRVRELEDAGRGPNPG